MIGRSRVFGCRPGDLLLVGPAGAVRIASFRSRNTATLLVGTAHAMLLFLCVLPGWPSARRHNSGQIRVAYMAVLLFGLMLLVAHSVPFSELRFRLPLDAVAVVAVVLGGTAARRRAAWQRGPVNPDRT